MSSENDHGLGDAGDAPAPDAAKPTADEPSFQPRPFRGWASARVEGKRPSLAARVASLFRGGDKGAVEERPPAAQRPSLEIEIHEDRISAAAEAIEQAGEQAFAEDRAAPESLDEIFASVEDALPAEEPRRFEPPPVDPFEDLDLEIATKIDFGSTQSMEPEPGLGSTQELAPPTPVTRDSTRDSTRDDAASYFGNTLDPAVFGPTDSELEADTDEFEIVALQSAAAPVPEGVDDDTARVSRKSLIESLLFWRNKNRAEVGPGSTVVEAPPAFLFSKFRTFYNEIIRFKHQKTEFTAGFSTAIVTEYAADLSPDSAAETLSKNLTAMLELQAAEAMWMGGESAERYPDAQYAMAALADETFTHLEWDGQSAWHKNLLELKLFKTHCAEVELFRRIDRLLKDQPDSAAARDLARVYLLVIAAGFRGKYRPFGLTRALAEYRQRLYEYIHEGGDALMIYAPERRIFPEAAQRTLVGEAVARYTGAQRWAVILAFLVVGYTAVAHVAWSKVSADLKDVTDRIRAGATVDGNP